MHPESMDPLTVLDETKAALRVLLFIYRNEGAIMTTLLRGVPSAGQKAVYTAVETLIKLGLIREVYEEKGAFGKRKFYLTEKGRRVGELLETIADILVS